MRLKLQFVVLFLFALSMLSLHDAGSDAWTPGVAVGDYFTYQMYGVFTSNRSNTSMVIPQFEYNNTQWVRINITGVDGSVVHQVYTLHFVNETETSFPMDADVNPTNTSNKPTGQAVPICAENAAAGDTIPGAGLVLNDTVWRSYGDEQRETTHAEWNVTDDWGEGYFDRQTGIMVDFVRTHRFLNNATGEAVEKTDVIKLIDTNRWETTTPPNVLWLQIAVLVGVAAAAFAFVAVYWRRFRKTSQRLTVQEQITNKDAG